MKKIGISLIILGIFIIIYPVVNDIKAKSQQRKLMDTYIEIQGQSLSDEEIELTPKVEFRETKSSVEAAEDSVPEVAKAVTDAIGMINIPSIDVNLPILHDATVSNLKKAAAIVKDTSFPWEKGNTAIAAHRGRAAGSFFSRLGEVKIGDMVTLEFTGQKYTYEVYDIFTVLPHEIHVLDDIPGETTVTLITCDPPIKSTHRLIVRGRLMGID